MTSPTHPGPPPPGRRGWFRPVATWPPAPHSDGETLADVRGVTARLGGTTVLRDVDLPVRAGEVMALVGPNGAGKSTLLSVLAADTTPDAGEVRVHGRAARAWRPRDLALRRAVLPQNSHVSFPFTVAEVVAMGRAPWAGLTTEAADRAAVTEAMAATEVTEFAARPFSALSGGERARVALARVLAQRTPLLLLDEPTAALDLRHQEVVMRVCRDRAAAGDAVVVVLHDLGLAAAHADRVAVLHDGRLAGAGPPGSVLTADLVGAVYRQPVRVLHPPESGGPLIVPVRGAAR